MRIKLITVLILVGLSILLFPSDSVFAGVIAGDGTAGCCITNGNQCNPQCGNVGDSCFNLNLNSNDLNPCDGTIFDSVDDAPDCGGVSPTNTNCFVPGAICTQIENNVAGCFAPAVTPTPSPTPSPTPTPSTTPSPSPTPSPTPTPSTTPSPSPTPEPDCIDDADCVNQDICYTGMCVMEFGICGYTFDETNDPSCEGGPIVIVPTIGQWGMLLAALVLGLFAVIRLRSVKDSELS